VWIGVNAVIMPGVKIGDGAIVGANSVVTKNVEPYSIVAGIPAELLRFRFSEDDQKKAQTIDLTRFMIKFPPWKKIFLNPDDYGSR